MFIDRIKFAKFQFMIEPVDELLLPDYKGSTLRGGFGHSFKKVVCINPTFDCPTCILKEKCSYYSIFETKVDKPIRDVLRTGSDAPHPFVLEPPLDEQRSFKKGDTLSYSLILVGTAIDYLPYFIFTFDNLGERIGLGRGRGKFKLLTVTDAKTGFEIYDGKKKILNNRYETYPINDFVAPSDRPDHEQVLKIKFVTPTRIKTSFMKDKTRLVKLDSENGFELFFEPLYHRLFILSHLYCSEQAGKRNEEQTRYDSKEVYSLCRAIKVESSQTRWQDWERFSSRQDTRMKLGGFVGEITYKGDFSNLMPVIRMGEHLHLGKASSFGLGKYQIEC